MIFPEPYLSASPLVSSSVSIAGSYADLRSAQPRPLTTTSSSASSCLHTHRRDRALSCRRVGSRSRLIRRGHHLVTVSTTKFRYSTAKEESMKILARRHKNPSLCCWFAFWRSASCGPGGPVSPRRRPIPRTNYTTLAMHSAGAFEPLREGQRGMEPYWVLIATLSAWVPRQHWRGVGLIGWFGCSDTLVRCVA